MQKILGEMCAGILLKSTTDAKWPVGIPTFVQQSSKAMNCPPFFSKIIGILIWVSMRDSSKVNEKRFSSNTA